MREIKRIHFTLAYGAISIGIILGIFSIIRVGSLFIAAGMVVIAISGLKDSRSRGVISTYLPFLIAISLCAMALALPRGL
jgi:hypothetical protein